MKKTFYIFAAILLLASCEKDASRDSQIIQFQFSLPETRATASAFEADDAISLYAVEWNGATQMPLQVGGNFLNNEKLTYNGTTWIPNRTLYWSDNPCDFYALYPYQAEIGTMEKYPFSLTIDQNGDGYEASDLLYAKAENVARTGGPVQMSFKHMMSKLVVVLEKGAQFEGDIPNDVVAHIYNTVGSCTVNWLAGSVEKDAFGAKPTLTKISNSRFEAVVIPQNLEKRTPLIELTMGGIAYLLETSLSFRPGYVHTVTVTLNTSPDQEQIEISIDPGVTNWNN